MADRMAAEIWVGGKLPRSLLDEFPISDLRLDFDENPFDATTEEGILMPATKTACCTLPTARQRGASFRNWKAGCGNTTFRSSGSRRANTGMIRALSSFALTCQVHRTDIRSPIRMALPLYATMRSRRQ